MYTDNTYTPAIESNAMESEAAPVAPALLVTLRDAAVFIGSALNLAAKKDVRFYLNGVCLRLNANGVAVMDATDGHVMGRYYATIEGGHTLPALGLIIPRDACEAIVKAKALDITIMCDPLNDKLIIISMGRTQLSVEPHDARYPDFAPIMNGVQPCAPAMFQPSVLGLVCKAAEAMRKLDKKGLIGLDTTVRGDSVATAHIVRYVKGGDHEQVAAVYVMPMRR